MELQASGITISYDLQGDGPVVTLIHALGLDRTLWYRQVPALAGSYRTLAYDVRGHGRSSKPTGPYSLSLFADDLRAMLGALGIARTHLVGISMGGMIAQALALAHPELVASLVLVDTSSRYDEESRRLFEQRATIAETQGLATLVEGTIERWFTAPFRQEHPEIVDRFRQIVLRNDPRAYAAAARSLKSLDFADELPRLACPTLVVVGDQDPSTTPAMAELIHRQIPGSRLLVIPNAMHLSPVEQPEVFNPAVLEFLGSVGEA